MAMGLSGQRKGRYQQMSEINVTPLVDVMLVLLIVFMVTAPLLTLGVQVELPRANANPLGEDQTPLQISIDRNGAIFIEDVEVPSAELLPRLAAIAQERRDPRIYVRGDTNLDYGAVMNVVAQINTAGFRKVALVTQRGETP